MTIVRQDRRLVPNAAYFHIPFCAHHCGYCDFAVAAEQDHRIDQYLDALAVELTTLETPRDVDTIFVGGGTPTHLSASQLEQFLASVNRWFPGSNRTEFSIESTPESLTRDKVDVLKRGGVTRVSVGVQSFHDESLVSLDRLHRTHHIPHAAELVRSEGLELSLDLIFAAPNATPESWAADLEAAIQLAPDHISTYGLTYETGTPLWKRRRAGEIIPLTEDAELAMYEHAIDRLTEAGFEHYEISNFAKPGKRCRHNETYWANEAYFGFGVGAARYVNGSRELNVRNTQDYIRRVLTGESPTFQREVLNDSDRAFETISTQLRRSMGIERGPFENQTGFSLDSLVGERLRSLVGHGLLDDHGHAVKLTRRGKCLADSVIVDLMKSQNT
ncbi:MAG: radical SAM family heme chaperone HemW [Gemmataceae bacterium]